jgi:hypothetical protein
MEVVEKVKRPDERQRTAYYLTESGRELSNVVDALLVWGARWAFEEPAEEELDPVLLMWWMRGRVCEEALPEQRVVVRFDFTGTKEETFWLLLTREDVSVCLTDPGFDLDVLVTADLAAYFQIWLGRLAFAVARREGLVTVDGIPRLADAFPDWFGYSLAAPAVRAARAI